MRNHLNKDTEMFSGVRTCDKTIKTKHKEKDHHQI